MLQTTRPPLILHVFPSFAVGGVQVRFAAIANRFGRRWRHAVIAMDGNLSCRERLHPALDVEFPAVTVQKGDTLGNVLRFRRLLRGMQPDLLVTSNWGSIEWSLANPGTAVRQVHIEDGFGPDDRDGRLLRRVRLRRAVLRRRLVILPSRTLWEIATRVWRLDPRWLRHVPNGIDLARFAGLPQPGEWPGPVIGTVAALRPEKNIARLLRAFALAAPGGPAGLVIAGDGPERPALEGLAQELGIRGRVRFTGHLANPVRLFKQLDVFALSSDTEQMPLSLLEAMAAGLPVAATDVGDVRSMLADANAPYVTALDDAALATGLRSLLDQAALRQTLGAANRAKAEQEFNQEAMFQAWAAAFDGTPGPAQPD